LGNFGLWALAEWSDIALAAILAHHQLLFLNIQLTQVIFFRGMLFKTSVNASTVQLKTTSQESAENYCQQRWPRRPYHAAKTIAGKKKKMEARSAPTAV
jgi:hypothetical protein